MQRSNVNDNHSHQGGSEMKKTTKENKKNKKLWADPMCYPAFIAK